jgi:hypothetical protein
MPPDRRPPRGGRLVPSVLGALWCKPHLTVPQRVPLQCARPWGGEAGPSRQWRGVSPPNGTGRCWSHGPGERCRRVNTCPATPPRQETLASSRPFDAIGPAPAPGWALPGDAAIALYGARHPQRHRFLQRCNAPAVGGAGAGPCWSHGPMPIAAGGRFPGRRTDGPFPDTRSRKRVVPVWTGALPRGGIVTPAARRKPAERRRAGTQPVDHSCRRIQV